MSRTLPSSEAALENGLQVVRGDKDTESQAAMVLDGVEVMSDEYLLSLAADIQTHSREWFDSSIRNRVVQNYDLFHSTHTSGSKYRSKWYEKRSKVFRPRTRISVNKLTAGIAVALFSTADVVHCSAENESDPAQRLAADLNQALLQYRLETTIPWYKIVVAAAQEAGVTGVVISKQVWDYREVEFETEAERVGPSGEPVALDRFVESEVKQDTPTVELVPIENFGIDPACNWADPVGSSPYLVEYQPMYVGKLIERMSDPNQLPRYRQLSVEKIHAAMRPETEVTRHARQGRNTQDRYEDVTHKVSEYDVVWVHHHIVDIGGQDYVYDTLGTSILLSDPMPIEEVYPTGKRPYVMGSMLVEAHKHYQSAPVDLLRPIQEETNDLANLRLDNIKLALNKRYFVKRGQVSDLQSLLRNVPGGLVFMNDTERDVKVHSTPDVTRGSFEEADRLNMEVDELMGTFTQTSILNHRKQMETVGGMNLLSDGASQVTELMVRMFVETWVEPVLRQIIDLEQALESDQHVMALVAQSKKAEIEDVFKALDSPVNIRVNVGFGATNPAKRVEKLAIGLSTLGNILPETLARVDDQEVVRELFGALGYKDGSRFFPDDAEADPKVAQLEQQVAQLQQMIQTKQIESQAKMAVEKLKGEIKERVEQMKIMAQQDQQAASRAFEQYKLELQSRLDAFDAQLKAEQNEIAKRELWMQREALSHSISMAERQFALAMGARQSAEAEQLSDSLREPPSGMPFPEAEAPDLPGEDMAGTINRGNYGMIPGQSG